MAESTRVVPGSGPRRVKARKAATLPPEQLAMAWQSSSLLLGHPGEALLNQLALVHRASHLLPDEVGGPLRAAVVHLEGAPLEQLQQEYVETFDVRRRRSLGLAHLAHDDTRERGAARLRLQQTYLRSNYVITDGVLPDHLCVLLDFAATVDQTLGLRLLLDHRAALELLLTSLQEVESGWSGAVAAVTATLPPLAGEDWEALRRLAVMGPSQEEVRSLPVPTSTSTSN